MNTAQNQNTGIKVIASDDVSQAGQMHFAGQTVEEAQRRYAAVKGNPVMWGNPTSYQDQLGATATPPDDAQPGFGTQAQSQNLEAAQDAAMGWGANVMGTRVVVSPGQELYRVLCGVLLREMNQQGLKGDESHLLCLHDNFSRFPDYLKQAFDEVANRVTEGHRKEAQNWENTAQQYARDDAHHTGQLQRIGLQLGHQVYFADDGGFSPDMLLAKIPEGVESLNLAYHNYHAAMGTVATALIELGFASPYDLFESGKNLNPYKLSAYVMSVLKTHLFERGRFHEEIGKLDEFGRSVDLRLTEYRSMGDRILLKLTGEAFIKASVESVELAVSNLHAENAGNVKALEGLLKKGATDSPFYKDGKPAGSLSVPLRVMAAEAVISEFVNVTETEAGWFFGCVADRTALEKYMKFAGGVISLMRGIDRDAGSELTHTLNHLGNVFTEYVVMKKACLRSDASVLQRNHEHLLSEVKRIAALLFSDGGHHDVTYTPDSIRQEVSNIIEVCSNQKQSNADLEAGLSEAKKERDRIKTEYDKLLEEHRRVLNAVQNSYFNSAPARRLGFDRVSNMDTCIEFIQALGRDSKEYHELLRVKGSDKAPAPITPDSNPVVEDHVEVEHKPHNPGDGQA